MMCIFLLPEEGAEVWSSQQIREFDFLYRKCPLNKEKQKNLQLGPQLNVSAWICYGNGRFIKLFRSQGKARKFKF